MSKDTIIKKRKTLVIVARKGCMVGPLGKGQWKAWQGLGWQRNTLIYTETSFLV